MVASSNNLSIGEATRRSAALCPKEEKMDDKETGEATISSTALTINERQDEIVDEFLSIGDLLSQYEYLIEFAASLPSLEEGLKNNENLVKGCQSQAWLVMKLDNGRLSLQADSNTLIVRGILYLLIDVLDGQQSEDVATASIYFLEKAELMTTFSASRRQGIGSIIASIKQFAERSVQ
jgi:cysteine desulfuration protein SufE